MKIVNDTSLQSLINTIKGLFLGRSEAQTIISHASDKIATTEKEVVSLGGETTAPDYASLPLLCGQPMILFADGTPQVSVVPKN